MYFYSGIFCFDIHGTTLLDTVKPDYIWGHLDTSTILLPMVLMSIGNISMLFLSMRYKSMRHTSTSLCWSTEHKIPFFVSHPFTLTDFRKINFDYNEKNHRAGDFEQSMGELIPWNGFLGVHKRLQYGE